LVRRRAIMRKSLWFTSVGGAVRISIIALACLFLSATGARADTFTYTYTGNDFTTFSGPYTGSDKVTGTVVLSAPLPANLPPTTDETALLVSYSFSDGVQTLTNLNSAADVFSFETSATGAIDSWFILFFSTPSATQINTSKAPSFNTFDFGGPNPLVTPFGENFGSAGVWSGPVEGTVPEPGTLSMMFSGLLGLGLLVGVKRYRGNRLANLA
jgi:hypothetical protein